MASRSPTSPSSGRPSTGHSIKSFSNRQPRRPSQRDSLSVARQGHFTRQDGAVPTGFANLPLVLCYRNSIVALLMNCVPFLGWLDIIHFPDCEDNDSACLACILAETATAFWSAYQRGHAEQFRSWFENSFWLRTKMMRESGLPPWDATATDVDSAKDSFEINASTCSLPTEDFDAMDHDGFAAEEEQQDAHEFLVWLLSIMKAEQYHKDDLDLSALFDVGIERTVKCGNSNCRAERLQPINRETVITVHLPKILAKDSTTIEECLESSFIPEERDEYRCGYCDIKGPATVTQTFKEAPEVLLIQLSRFVQYGNQNGARKANTNVQLSEALDLTHHLDNARLAEGEKALYELVGVSSHAGTTKSGHYEAWIKGPNDQWLRINDQTVSDFSLEEINSYDTKWGRYKMTPYVLAYVRRTPNDP